MNTRNMQLFLAAVFSGIVLFCLVSTPGVSLVSLAGIQLPRLCFFKYATGLDCPGCGLTRAVVFVFHGEIQQSLRLHLLGIPAALLIAAQIPYRLLLAYRGKDRLFDFSFDRTWIGIAVGVVLLLPWIYRMLTAISNP